jgi:hypothetical protein
MPLAYSTLTQGHPTHQLPTMAIYFYEALSGRVRHPHLAFVLYGHHNSMQLGSQSQITTHLFRSKTHRLPSSRRYHGIPRIQYGSQNQNPGLSSIVGGYHTSRSILR